MEPLDSTPTAGGFSTDDPSISDVVSGSRRHTPPSARRTLAGLLLGFVVVAGAGAGVMGHFDGPTPTAAVMGVMETLNQDGLVAASNTSGQNATAQAVQQAIQQSNQEQVQAVASQNPSVMSDTATSAYYQQMLQVNQNLLSNGASSIALASLQWGPVNVTGTTATATTYETWMTTYTDGTTDESQAQNNYTLVQTNGAWLIQQDDQPSNGQNQSSTSGPAAPAPQTSIPPSPNIPGSPNNLAVSNNWSGYAATTGTYTAVNGTWTVPQFSPTMTSGTDATWIGIGGVTSQDLIQAGTQEIATGTGTTGYQAWIETLPQAAQTVPLSVHAGDSVSVSITNQSKGTWLIAFKDSTTGQTYQSTVQYASSESSAEWIEEAPSNVRGTVLPLDSFGMVSFSNATAVQNGQTVSIGSTNAQPITLMGMANEALAVPSSLSSDGASFNVTRTSAPAIQQAQPTSPRGRRRYGG